MDNSFHVVGGRVYLVHYCGTIKQFVAYNDAGRIVDNCAMRKVVVATCDRRARMAEGAIHYV